MTDHSATVLQYAHRLLMSKPGEAIRLAEVAQAFEAEGAGVIMPLAGSSVVQQAGWASGVEPTDVLYPWARDKRLFDQVQAGLEPVVVDEPTGSWLLFGSSESGNTAWLMWVRARGARVWSPGERACLPLVAQAWARLAFPASGREAAREQLRLRQRLEQTVQVAGRLAHDFGNVLAGILGFTELTINQLAEKSLARRYMTEVLESARAGTAWVHRLQVLSRREMTQFEPTRLAGVLSELEAHLRSEWGDRVTLQTTLASDLPEIQIEKESLRQLLLELLRNSREAIAQHGVVTVAAHRVEVEAHACHGYFGKPTPGSFVEIIITDSGCGFSEEASRRLFKDFFFSTKPRHRGLGLVTALWLTQLFHGGLRFGPHPVKGTTLRILLPLAGTGRRSPSALNQQSHLRRTGR